MEDNVMAETPVEVVVKKKRGWPKGKPRKPKVVMGELPGSAWKAEDAKPKQRRRRRRNVSGVTVGKDFYPGIMAVWENHGKYLRIRREGGETWVPVGDRPIQVKGFTLPPFPSGVGTGSSWTVYPAANTATYPVNSGTTYAASGTTGGTRIVNPADFVNVEPQREAYVQRNAAARNQALENLMGGGPTPDLPDVG